MMPRIFLTHIPEMLTNYYGERAVNALRALGEVRFNPGADVLDAGALADAARGCEIIVSDRQTAGSAAFFARAPDVVAFLRCAIDIRNIDVAAVRRACWSRRRRPDSWRRFPKSRSASWSTWAAASRTRPSRIVPTASPTSGWAGS
jgi:hypothetical protein